MPASPAPSLLPKLLINTHLWSVGKVPKCSTFSSNPSTLQNQFCSVCYIQLNREQETVDECSNWKINDEQCLTCIHSVISIVTWSGNWRAKKHTRLARYGNSVQALLSTAHLQTLQSPVTESHNRSALKPKTNNIKGKMNEHSSWQSAPRAGKGVYVKPLENLDPPLKTQSSSQHRELSAEEKTRDQKQCPRSHVPAEHFAQSKRRLWERSPWFL